MKKMLRFMALLLAVVMLYGLVACANDKKDGNGSNNPDVSNGTEDGTDKKGDSKEQVTIRMVESLTSPARTELLNSIIDKFQQENTDIKIELISPPLKNADDKINQMLMSKQELDLLEVRDHTVKQFTNNNYLEALDPYFDKWEEYSTLNATAKNKASAVGGAAYMIPYGFYERLLFYRADWFKEAGLNPPSTWDELYEAGKKLTDPSKNRYGYSFRGGPGGQGYADMLIQAFVGDKLNIDNAYFTKDGETIFEQPEAVEALELHKKLYTDISPKDSLNWGYPEMVENFYSGVTAMLIQDPEVIATCEEHMEEGTWATAPIPVGPAGKTYLPIGYAGWGMTSFSKHKEEAWRFLSYLSSSEINTEFCKKNSLIPVHTTAGEDEFFKLGPFSPYIEMNAKPDVFIGITSPFDYKGWGPHLKNADSDNQKLLLGQMQPEEIAKKWADYWNKEEEEK